MFPVLHGNAALRAGSTAILILLLLSGCATTAGRGTSTPTPPATVGAADSARQLLAPDDPQCPMGTPQPHPGIPLGPTQRIDRQGYALLHSADTRTPYWVCERYTAQSLRSLHDRKGLRFSADPLLSGPRAVPSDYTGSSKHRTRAGEFPIDIGHMAPAESHSSTAQRLADTFYLSNAVPQHRAMNRGQWARLEACARTAAAAHGHAWVISGPMMANGPDGRAAPVETIGNGVVIPTHTWKILVYRTASLELRAWAVIMPNRTLPAGSTLEDFAASIDEIEAVTGFDFLPQLTPVEQRRLESVRYSIVCG